MNQERNEERTDLDQLLAQMAQETPEMPADFHARWTEAVRAEAGQAKTEKKQDSRRQWRYILSAAAVFVFLIGGTLLTRGMDQKDRGNSVSVVEDTMVPAADSGTETAGAGAVSVPGQEAEEFVGAANFAAANEAAEEAATAVPDLLAETMSAKSAKPAEAGVKADMALEADMDMAAAETEEEPEEEAAAETAAEPEAEPAAEQPRETVEPARESEFVSFLKDLGLFTLKALAAAAVIAAVWFGVKALRKAGKK